LAKVLLSNTCYKDNFAKLIKTCLELLGVITPTVTLLDLSMPIMDGWELLHKICGNAITEAIPVFAVAAHAIE
jgi:CheY-like chemotaxis protein